MTERPHDLAALLGSRICHDLISPIGAIGNGLELISMTGSGNGPEIEMINESVQNAQARIKFYRVAYGAVGDAQGMAAREVGEILDGISSGSRVKVDWRASGEVRRDEAKLVFLLLQCIESAMAYGGVVTITQADRRWRLVGSARKFRDLDPLWSHLKAESEVETLAPSQIQFALAREQLQASQRKLSLSVGESEIRIEA